MTMVNILHALFFIRPKQLYARGISFALCINKIKILLYYISK